MKKKLDTISLQLYNDEGKLGVDKDITYFLIHHSGAPDAVHVADVEGYLGTYKWASIEEALGLIEYRNLRELVRSAYEVIGTIARKDSLISKLF